MKAHIKAGDPVISVDTKKKELVGAFRNAGRTWRPQGEPVEVNVHDFPHLGRGKAVPYGAYDIARNRAVVNVGVSHDTATVCHYPPGTSKWNKIEHRLFSFISLNWRGRPLVNYETVVNLIGATKTRTGLRVKAGGEID